MLSEQLNLFGEPLRSPRPPANIRISPDPQDEPEAPEAPVLTAVLMPDEVTASESPIAAEALPVEVVEQRATAIEQSLPEAQATPAAPEVPWVPETAEVQPTVAIDGAGSEPEDEPAPLNQAHPVLEQAATDLEPAHTTTLDELTELIVNHQTETPDWVGETIPDVADTDAVDQRLPALPTPEAEQPQTGETHDDWSHGKLNIPPDRELFQRQYYTMRETTAMMGMTHAQLRNWENDFDILQPRKNRKGDRYFRPVDIKNLELIYHLIKEKKYTADGARAYLKQHKHALDHFALVKKLEGLKSFLFELKANL